MKKLPWLKFWNNMLDNPKVGLLSDNLFRQWINLLCLACRNDGWLPDVKIVAFTLRCSEADADKHIQALVKARLFDKVDGRYRPHDWDHWQRPSKTSTPRVREHRDRKARHDQHAVS